MNDKVIRTGVLLGIGVNIVLFICLYFLEYRVSLLESQHDKTTCHLHE